LYITKMKMKKKKEKRGRPLGTQTLSQTPEKNRKKSMNYQEYCHAKSWNTKELGKKGRSDPIGQTGKGGKKTWCPHVLNTRRQIGRKAKQVNRLSRAQKPLSKMLEKNKRFVSDNSSTGGGKKPKNPATVNKKKGGSEPPVKRRTGRNARTQQPERIIPGGKQENRKEGMEICQTTTFATNKKQKNKKGR